MVQVLNGKADILVENLSFIHQTFPVHHTVAFGSPLDPATILHPVTRNSDTLQVGAITSPPEWPIIDSFDKIPAKIRQSIGAHVARAPPSVRKNFYKLLSNNAAIFSQHQYDLGLIPNKEHSISLSQKDPVYIKQFTIPKAHLEFITRLVLSLKEHGLVKKCSSPYNTPIFAVPKMQKTDQVSSTTEGLELRAVQDFRGVNRITYGDKYSIRTIETCLTEIGSSNSRFFSTIDLTSAFWQMALAPESQKFTAFTIPGLGQFMWTRGAMGLSGCPATFARIMDEITSDLKDVICYIDDILCHSPTEDAHMQVLDKLFTRLRKNHLKVKLDKCHFFQDNVTFLGYQITNAGVQPGRLKATQIRDTEPPRTLKQLQSFMGLANFFRQFVYKFSTKANPLYDVLKHENTPLAHDWKKPLPAHVLQAFFKLRKEIASLPKLAFPRPKGRFHLYVDASLGDENTAGGLGAALFQEQQLSSRICQVPLGFASRRLRDRETRYPIFALELQAAVFGLETFDHILRGQHFELYTDHKPVIANTKLSHKTLNRLQELIGRHSCNFNHISSTDNVVADYLSRHALALANKPTSSDYEKPLVIATIQVLKHTLQPFHSVNSLLAVCPPELILQAQAKCPQAAPIIQMLSDGSDSTTPMHRTMEYFFKKNLLFARNKKSPSHDLLFIPSDLRRKYMLLAHKSVGHGGYDKTIHRLKKHSFWPDMDADLRMFLQSCGPCAIKKARATRTEGKIPVQPLPDLSQPNGRVHMDLFGPLDRRSSPNEPPSKAYVMVMTDALTKWVRLAVIPNKEAQTVAQTFLNDWCLIFGHPQAICTDQGKEFTNDVMRVLLQDRSIKHFTTTPYHPAANGQAEVFNRTMGQFLRAALHEEKLDPLTWPSLIPLLQFRYNTSLHQAIKKTPFEVLFGYDPRVPGFHLEHDLLRDASNLHISPDRWSQASQQNHKTRTKQLANTNFGACYPEYHTHDKILWQQDKLPASNPKLAPKWFKGTIVMPGSSAANYWIKPASGNRRNILVHVSKIRLDTTIEEKLDDPSFKPALAPNQRKPTTTSRRLRSHTLAQVATITSYQPPPPGTSFTRHDLALMFATYQAHRLQPPTFEINTPTCYMPLAVLPQAAGAHQPVEVEPIPPPPEAILPQMDNVMFNNIIHPPIVEDNIMPHEENGRENDIIPPVHLEDNNPQALEDAINPPTPPINPVLTGAIPKQKTPVSPPFHLNEEFFAPDMDSHVTTRRNKTDSTPHLEFDYETPSSLDSPIRSVPSSISPAKRRRHLQRESIWLKTPSGQAYSALARQPPDRVVVKPPNAKNNTLKILHHTAQDLVDQWVPATASYAPDIKRGEEILTSQLKKCQSESEAKACLLAFIKGTTHVINEVSRREWRDECSKLKKRAENEALNWYPN